MGVSRGDIVIVAAPGDYGRPRPALVLQSDRFQDMASVVVALLTTEQRPDAGLFRKPIRPADGNGLRQPSDVMVDKIVTLPRAKIGPAIGHLTSSEMAEIGAALALFLGL